MRWPRRVLFSNQVGVYVQDQIKINDKFVLLLGGRKNFSDVDTRIIHTGALTSQQDEAWTGAVSFNNL